MSEENDKQNGKNPSEGGIVLKKKHIITLKKLLTLALTAAMLIGTGITALAAPITQENSDPKEGGTTVNYTVGPVYTVVIPESVTLGDTAVTKQIKIYGADENSDVILQGSQKVNVALTSSANNFHVVNNEGYTVDYTVNDKNAVADLSTVAGCTAEEGKKNTDITFTKTGNSNYAGTYTDTLTFTVILDNTQNTDYTIRSAFEDGAVIDFGLRTYLSVTDLKMANENGSYNYVSGGNLARSGSTLRRDGDLLILNVDFTGSPDNPYYCYVVTFDTADNSYTISLGDYVTTFAHNAVSLDYLKINGTDILSQLTKK